MLKFWVPQDTKGKNKDSLHRAMSSLVRFGLGYEVAIYRGDEWYLETDIIHEQTMWPNKVPQYLKLLKDFINNSNAM